MNLYPNFYTLSGHRVGWRKPLKCQQGRFQFLRGLALLGVLWFSAGTPLFAQEPPISPFELPTEAEQAALPVLPGVRLQLIAAKASYAMGEPIQIIMRYTYDGEGVLDVRKVDFDRSGRVGDYSFSATDAAGEPVRDPAQQLRGNSMGGPLYSAELSRTQPFEQRVTINHWLAFDSPGQYSLKALSTIVSPLNATASRSSFRIDSDSIILTITEPDEQSRRTRIQHARDVVEKTDQYSQETRFEAVQDLRFMLDPRAIPILVRALSDDWVNVRYESNLALLSFKDLIPVKAELRRIAEDDTVLITPAGKENLSSLYSEINRRVLNSNDKNTKAISAESIRYDELLRKKLDRQIANFPAAKAAETIFEAIYNYQVAESAENWNRVLNQAVALPPEVQLRAGERLLRTLKSDFKQGGKFSRETLVALKDAFKTTAQNDKVDGTLRLSALLGLHQQGDESARDLLVEDVVSRKPQILRLDAGYEWQREPSREILGSYRSKEISAPLLEMIDGLSGEATSENFLLWRSLLQRLRDFGRAASASQLLAVYEKVKKDVPPQWDSDGEMRRIVLQALSINSADDAVKLIRQFPKPKNDYGPGDKVIEEELVRMTAPSASTLIGELLKSPDEREKMVVLRGLYRNVEDARDDFRSTFLKPQPAVTIQSIPQIIHLLESDSSPKVRDQAYYALRMITGIPSIPGPFDSTVVKKEKMDDPQLLKQWNIWWQEQMAKQAALNP